MATSDDTPRDEVFRDEKSFISDFRFSAEVAHVFDDMVSRSVPFYGETQRMVAEIAAKRRSITRTPGNV